MIPNAVIEEKNNGLLAIVQRVLSNAESNGMPFTHTDNVTYHFQCRLVDRTNWLVRYYYGTIVESQADMRYRYDCDDQAERTWLMLDRQTALDTLLKRLVYTTWLVFASAKWRTVKTIL
jgi:hypothetical protein